MMWVHNAVISANSQPWTANCEAWTANCERRTFCCDPACGYPSAVVTGHPKGWWRNAIGKGIFATWLTDFKPGSSRKN